MMAIGFSPLGAAGRSGSDFDGANPLGGSVLIDRYWVQERFALSYDVLGRFYLVQGRTLISLTALTVVTLTASAQTRKNWRDRAEYDLYSEIVKPDLTPVERLQNLDKWKVLYPESEFADTRLRMYLLTYQEMNNHRAAFDTAGEILKKQPNDLASLGEIVEYGLNLLPDQANASLSAQNKNDLDTIQRTSHYILDNLDLIYARRENGTAGIAGDAIRGWGPRISDATWPKFKLLRSAQTAIDRAAARATQH